MPTASDELRKAWPGKMRWVKVGLDVDIKSLGAVASFGRWAWLREGGDMQAERYLREAGYVEHRFMWYRPKWSMRGGKQQNDWRATERESSALSYLCDEWDHSYDLRGYGVILAEERRNTINAIGAALVQGKIDEADKILIRYTSFRLTFT